MTRNPPGILQRWLSARWSAEIAALLAGALFFAQSLYYAHANRVSMDEGTYLTKGLLYVTGVYQPFQEYGPWTNKMPLAFLIPGWVQLLFGPGLRTGRYFSIFLGLLMLLGLWLALRRISSRWWAAGILWAAAIGPGNNMLYSMAITQVITACMLAWVFALTLGEKRPLWHTTLGAALAALLVLTRQNMLPVVPLLVLYLFWAHGWKSGLAGAATAGVVLAWAHARYWPEIVGLWLPWLPLAVRGPFTAVSLDLGEASSVSVQLTNLQTKVYVFWEGLRYNFLALAGAVAAWILWPARKDWQSEAHFKISVFLSLTLAMLTGLHLWAAVGKSYCVYCYTVYLPFFSLTGLLLVAASFHSWLRRPAWWRQALAALFVLVTTTGVGFGAYQALDELVMNLPVPRMRNMRILPGTTDLWRFLANRFGWSYELLQQLLPTALGLLAGLLILALAAAAFVWALRKKGSLAPGYLALAALLVVGTLLSPTPVMSGSSLPSDCGLDVIASHEAVGAHLAKIIPPGSLVYWQNDLSPLPLLYLLPGARIFPPQLNHWYSYFQGGDPDLLYRQGFWNDELAAQWKHQADYLLIADRYVDSFNATDNRTGEYDELAPSPPTLPCQGNSIIHIFRRAP